MSVFVGGIEYVQVHCGTKGGGCGLEFAMTRSFYDYTKREGVGWYCPRGHSRRWADNTASQKLRKAEARNVHLSDQLEATNRELEQHRQTIVRDRHRIANGVCPCCTRSFDNVRRHITSQHPDYDMSELAGKAQFRCSCQHSFETYRALRTHQGHKRPDNWAKPDISSYRAHLTVV